MQLEGVIKVIGTTQQVSDSFKKRDIVIETADQYPQFIEIQFVQDKVSVLDQYKPGENVVIDINIRGREWTNPKDGVIKYFNTIQGWKIGYAGAHADAIEGAKHQAETFVSDGDDDLPF
jgi:single-stranded DNA-binding protein